MTLFKRKIVSADEIPKALMGMCIDIISHRQELDQNADIKIDIKLKEVDE